jgi:hypothetical protein
VSITNYTELKATVLDWVARPELTAQVEDFVRLAELETIEPLLRAKVLRADITLDAEVITLAADVGEVRSIRLKTDNYNHVIKIGTPEDLADFRRIGSTTGVPQRGAIVDGELLLAPAPAESYAGEIIYFEKLVPLSTSAPTNSTLTASPNVYLFAALAQAETYLEHDSRVEVWLTKAEGAIARLNDQRERAQLGAAGSTRLPVVIG